MTAPASRRNLYILGAIILAITAATRLPAPWRLGVVNDEMHHLESWRNRYRTGDTFPIFIQRIEATHQLTGKRLDLLKRFYALSPLVQRGFIILVDPQPPLFPTLAEIIEAVSHSSLTALRFSSLLASLLSIYLLYRVGVLLRDEWLGCWLAGLLAITHAAQVYAGIGRPYALGQCAVIGVYYAFLVDRQRAYASPWRFLLCALIAQATQWFAWLSIFPLVVAALAARVRRDRSVGRLLAQTWWYGLLSVLLALELLVQLKNPVITGQAGARGWVNSLFNVSVDSPFADLASFGKAGLWAAGLTFVAAAAVGVAALAVSKTAVTRGRLPLLAAVACGVAGILFLGEASRLILNYVVALIVVAGIGFRTIFASPRASMLAASAMVLAIGALSIFHPTNPYRYVFDQETPYEPVGALLKSQLRPGDSWAAYPYFRANVLYRSGPFPEPATPTTVEGLEDYVRSHRTGGDCYVFLAGVDLDGPEVPVLKIADRRWTFPDYHGGMHFNFLKFTVRPPPPSGAEPAGETTAVCFGMARR